MFKILNFPQHLMLVALLLVAQYGASASVKKNVLMIAVDDLRTQMSPYPEGGSYMHTPNMERIAATSMVFERAYVQVALCMPSRTSLLTGRRPDTSRSWTIEADQWFRFSSGNGNWTTLPGHFKNSGYLTIGTGKVFHETMPSFDPQDCTHSWSPEAVFSRGKKPAGLWDPTGDPENNATGLAEQVPDADEPKMQDGNITDHAVDVIKGLASGVYGDDVASGVKPFFLAIGLHKPHVPWHAPARFWDLYPIEKVPPVPHPHLVTNNAVESLQDWQVRQWCQESPDIKTFCGSKGESPLDQAYPADNTTVPADGAAYMRQAYFATVSWTDANIGKILDAFEATPFMANTVIAFWGDHGWHLGDNDQWAKMTNYEHGTKIPLMIGCGGKDCVGRTSALVEAIDIMPTLLEEAGIPIDPCPVLAKDSRNTNLCTEGQSLSHLLRQPTDTAQFTAAFSQFPRPEHPEKKVDVSCRSKNLTKGCAEGFCLDGCPNKMGYTVRTNLYRYTEWVAFNKCQNNTCPDNLADWNTVHAIELYNHSDSPVPNSYLMETENIAHLDSSQRVVAQLHELLKTFNTKGF